MEVRASSAPAIFDGSIQPPLLLEMFGSPGAGKTTIARAAAAGSERRGNADLAQAWKAQSRSAKVSLVARALLDAGTIALAARVALGAPLLRKNSLLRLFRLLIKSHWIRSQRERLFLEEGMLQDLWSIFYSAGLMRPDSHLVSPLVRSLYQRVDASIIYVDVDPQTAFARIRGRAHGKSRLDRLSDAELRSALEESLQLSRDLVAAAQAAGLVVGMLDASRPIDDSVHQLRSELRLLHSDGTRSENQ